MRITQITFLITIYASLASASKFTAKKCPHLDSPMGFEVEARALFASVCKDGNLQEAQRLYSMFPIDVRANRNTALRRAAAKGHTGLVAWLISVGADAAACQNEALFDAIHSGHVDTVKLLLSEPRVFPGKRGLGAIYLAAVEGRGEILGLLLPLYRTELGFIGDAAFEHAIHNNDVDVAQAFLADGHVEVALADNYYLRLACAEGCTAMVELLLGDPRVVLSLGQSAEPLILAAAYGHRRVVEKLLAAGINPTAKACKALRLAIINGHLDVVNVLLGEDMVVPTPKFNTALQLARRADYDEVVKAALAHPEVKRYWNLPRNGSGGRSLLTKSKESAASLASPRTRLIQESPIRTDNILPEIEMAARYSIDHDDDYAVEAESDDENDDTTPLQAPHESIIQSWTTMDSH